MSFGLPNFFQKSLNLPLRNLCTKRNIFPCDADMAQLVEHHLAKVGVAGSNPVVRSRIFHERLLGRSFYYLRIVSNLHSKVFVPS